MDKTEENRTILNRLELKFLALHNRKIDLFSFEEWVYSNEELIVKLAGQDTYEDLIILNYKRPNAKYELEKILSIKFRRLSLYEIEIALKSIMDISNLELQNIKHDKDNSVYETHSRYFFEFYIGGHSIGLNNPFKLKTQNYSVSNELRIKEFADKFKYPNKFFEAIYWNLDHPQVRIVINQELKNVDPNNYMEALVGTKNDIVMHIDNHILLIDKEFILTKMKKYWL